MIRSEQSRKLNCCVGVGMSMLLFNAQSLIAQSSDSGCCAFINSASFDAIAFDFSYVISLTNANIDAAGANALSLIEAHSKYCAALCKCSPVPFESSDSMVVSAAANLLVSRASAAGAVYADDYLWTGLEAEAFSNFYLGALDGFWDTFVRAISGQKRIGSPDFPHCAKTVGGIESASEIGGFAVALELSRINPALPIGVSIAAIADLSWGSDSFTAQGGLPFCGPVGPSSTCGSTVAVMVNAITIVVDVDLESSLPAQVQQGVFAHFADGSVTRLGFFIDAAFNDPDPNDDELFSVTNYPFVFDTSGSVASIELTASKDTFVNFDGDLDDDDKVCRSDRVLLMQSLGSSIPSLSYIPRADFNLDGTIDTIDLATFNSLPCNADWTCDGILDIFDFLAFQNDFAIEDPTADMDGNGTFDLFDFIAFQSAFVIGC